MAEFLRFSLFPLHVVVTDEDGEQTLDHHKAKVVITDDEAYVYTDGPNGQIEVSVQDRLLDFSGDAKTGWIATTEDGLTINIERSRACSCGSRLKGFNPFPGVPLNA